MANQDDFLFIPHRGQSMFPLIRDGDQIIVEKIKRSPIPGDIILYRDIDTKEWVAHRYLKKNTLKGDFSLVFDQVNEAAFMGFIRGIRRQENIYLWSQMGHPLKGFFLRATVYRTKNRPRWLRWSIVFILLIFSKAILILSSTNTNRIEKLQ